jgi:hypothetical protein
MSAPDKDKFIEAMQREVQDHENFDHWELVPKADIPDSTIITSAPKTKIHCKLFCDNTGACELLKLPKVRPRTKHFNNKLHHFREHVASGRISIHHVPTADQQGDIATKPLTLPLFAKFRKLILGW